MLSLIYHSMGCTIMTDKIILSRSQYSLCFITVSSRPTTIVMCSRNTRFFIDKKKNFVPVLVTNISFNLSFRICLAAGNFGLPLRAFVLFGVLHKSERQSRKNYKMNKKFTIYIRGEAIVIRHITCFVVVHCFSLQLS